MGDDRYRAVLDAAAKVCFSRSTEEQRLNRTRQVAPTPWVSIVTGRCSTPQQKSLARVPRKTRNQTAAAPPLGCRATTRHVSNEPCSGRSGSPASCGPSIHARLRFAAADTCKVGGGWIRLPLRPNLLLNSGGNRNDPQSTGFAGKSTGERSGPYPPAPPSPGRLRVSTRHAACHAPASRRAPGYAGSRAFPVKAEKGTAPRRHFKPQPKAAKPQPPHPFATTTQQVGAEGEPYPPGGS